jgi:hypothetical protein
MSTDRVLDRVRAANPVPAAPIADDELFSRIVAGPGDPRLAAPAAARRWRRRMGTRGLALIAAGVVLCGAGGTVGAVQLLSHDSPKALFKADPAGQYSRFPGHTGGTGQTVIPQSVHRAAAFTVPGVGGFAYWIALSRPSGWLCSAIRQPDGTWADLGDDNKYQLGGPVPGCGNLPWHDAHGFSYYNTSIQHRGTTWRIVYGYVPATGHPATVRDKVSGVSAPIGDGRYFAIVLPLCKGHTCSLPVPRPGSGFRLQTIDASGRVLVTDAYDPGM